MDIGDGYAAIRLAHCRDEKSPESKLTKKPKVARLPSPLLLLLDSGHGTATGQPAQLLCFFLRNKWCHRKDWRDDQTTASNSRRLRPSAGTTHRAIQQGLFRMHVPAVAACRWLYNGPCRRQSQRLVHRS